MQTRTKVIVGLLIVSAVLLLSSYSCLSVSAGRHLSASQFARFSATIAKSATHPNEGGASRAFSLYKQVMTSPSLTGSIELDGNRYLFPLPKYAALQKRAGDGLCFLTFVSPDETNDYFSRDLPQAGWTHDQQLGAGHFLTGHGVHMTIVQHFYLTSDISEFHVLINR